MTQITLSITAESADELKVAINGLAGIANIAEKSNASLVQEEQQEVVVAPTKTKPKKTSTTPKTNKAVVEEPTVEESVTEETAQEEVASEETAQEEVTPSVDVEQIRALAPVVAKSKGKEVLKELLQKYDASSISTLSKEHYDAFYAELEALNG